MTLNTTAHSNRYVITLPLRFGDKAHCIALEEIESFYAEEKYVFAQPVDNAKPVMVYALQDGPITQTTKSLRDIDQWLLANQVNQFVRIHRAQIINVQQVQQYTSHFHSRRTTNAHWAEVLTKDGHLLHVSRRYTPQISRALKPKKVAA